MLRELHIQHLAVIEDMRMQLQKGFNCFTGQTGAGKSLILGALEILLGLRPASVKMLRAGAKEACVEGLFELEHEAIAKQIGEILDLSLQAGDELLLCRRILASGRSSLSVNGRTATANMVKKASELLVDIHGQHDQLYLLKPANQMLVLDTFAAVLPQRERFMQLRRALALLLRRKAELATTSTLRRQQLELYETQAQEIDEIKPELGELEVCKNKFSKMANIKRLEADMTQIAELLEEGQEAINPRLKMALSLLQSLVRLDQELAPMTEQMQSAILMLQDGASDLERYARKLDTNPEELERVEARLNGLNKLVARYASDTRPGEDPLEKVLVYRQQIQELIDQLQKDDHDLSKQDRHIVQVVAELKEVGGQLSLKRIKASERLQVLIEKQLQDLGMGEAKFVFELTRSDNPVRDTAIGKNKIDIPLADCEEASVTMPAVASLEVAEMMVCTNPGQPMRPLREIASGGEMSRMMLAIKSVLAQSDQISVLVFDEIDANIGGRMGAMIGQKLRTLAHQSNHQVLCITHLPQIAAYADHHLHIAKTVQGHGSSRETCTTVDALDGTRRIEELANMLAGDVMTSTTRKQAREMLAAAS